MDDLALTRTGKRFSIRHLGNGAVTDTPAGCSEYGYVIVNSLGTYLSQTGTGRSVFPLYEVENIFCEAGVGRNGVTVGAVGEMVRESRIRAAYVDPSSGEIIVYGPCLTIKELREFVAETGA